MSGSQTRQVSCLMSHDIQNLKVEEDLELSEGELVQSSHLFKRSLNLHK